ncbi:MAG: DnaB-like helicase C-terminal domain-containing protein, partial [Desulfurobacteriaceae bacterium]
LGGDESLEKTAAFAVEYAVDNVSLLNALVEKLINEAKKRKELEVAKKLSTGEITREEALALLADLERDRAKKGGSVEEVAVRWLKKVEEQRESEELPGITTGSSEIDAVFTYRNELSLICARPSIGKTITALKLAYNQAKEGVKVLFFSLELTEDEVMARLVSIHTGAPLYKVVYGWLDMKVLVDATSYISELPIYIEPGPLTLPQIKARIYEIKPDIVYIDYVQKVTNHSKDFKSRKDFLDYVSAELLEIAKHHCPIVALAQLNRGARMGRDEPTVENIKETGNFEQDASNILLLHRNLKETPDKLQVKIAKCRVNAANKEIVVDFINGIPVFTPPGTVESEMGYNGE